MKTRPWILLASAWLSACSALSGGADPPPVETGSTSTGTVTRMGTTGPYRVDMTQSRLLILVRKNDGPACRIFHAHAVASLQNRFTFDLDDTDAAGSTFTAEVFAAGLDPDQDSYRQEFAETRGHTMTNAERDDIRGNLLGQLDAANHPVLTFAATGLSTLEGTGTAQLRSNLRGQESTTTFNATAAWTGTTLTITGEATLDGGAHGIPNGSFSDCVQSRMELKLNLVLVPGEDTTTLPDASVAAYMPTTFPDMNACDPAGGMDTVKDAIALNCLVCHGNPTQLSATEPLLTWEDWHTDSPLSVGEPLFADALTRLAATDGRRMPPEPFSITDAERDLISGWLQRGAHRFSCDAQGAPLPERMEPPTPTCASNETWVETQPEGPLMYPGRDCLQCHADEGKAEHVVVGGTVFPSLHQRDDCSGVDGMTGGNAGLRVVLRDATGMEWNLPVNSNGNFVLASPRGDLPLVLPYTAKVVNPATGAERHMVTPQNVLSCNACHAEVPTISDGSPQNPPPGRIVAP